MAADSPQFTLTLPSDARMLSVVRCFVEAVCQTFPLDRSIVHAIVVATGEAVTNVVRHAHNNRPDAQMQIQCQIRDNAIEIQILDEGEPFDLTAVPELDPAELRVGGRGVFLMRALIDELSCQPRGERGNALRMVKRYGPQSFIRECG